MSNLRTKFAIIAFAIGGSVPDPLQAQDVAPRVAHYTVGLKLATEDELEATSHTRAFAIAIFNNPKSNADKSACSAIANYYQNVILPAGPSGRPVLIVRNNRYVGGLDCQNLEKIYDASGVGYIKSTIVGLPHGDGPYIVIVAQTPDGGAWNYGYLDFSRYGNEYSTLDVFTGYYAKSAGWYCAHDVMAPELFIDQIIDFFSPPSQSCEQ